MPSTQRNPQLVPDEYREESATAENSSSLSSPVIIDVPSTPRTMHPAMQTPPNTTQGPLMGQPPIATPTPNNDPMLLMQCMMQQMDDMAHANVQMQADMAHNSTQMLVCMAELENQNQELCEEVMTRNSQLPIHKRYARTRQPVSPAAHSAWFASHTSDHRSPRFEPKTFPNELMPQENLDDTPWGHSIMYTPLAAINQPTPRHVIFEDSHHSPRRLGSAFQSITPAQEQQVQHEPRLECPPLTP
jgi:hypothetical protein